MKYTLKLYKLVFINLDNWNSTNDPFELSTWVGRRKPAIPNGIGKPETRGRSCQFGIKMNLIGRIPSLCASLPWTKMCDIMSLVDPTWAPWWMDRPGWKVTCQVWVNLALFDFTPHITPLVGYLDVDTYHHTRSKMVETGDPCGWWNYIPKIDQSKTLSLCLLQSPCLTCSTLALTWLSHPVSKVATKKPLNHANDAGFNGFSVHHDQMTMCDIIRKDSCEESWNIP